MALPRESSMSLADSPVAEASEPWPEIDRRFVHPTRPVPPAFPVELLPEEWRAWVDACAPSFTSVDYIAHGLLGAASSLCGPRIVVDVTPHWREPLVLWHALVGGPSTGKTPALAAARKLVERFEPGFDGSADPSADKAGAPAKAPGIHARGRALWCDDLAGWRAERSD